MPGPSILFDQTRRQAYRSGAPYDDAEIMAREMQSPTEPCEVINDGRCVCCGDCQACERRISAAAAPKLTKVSSSLLVNSGGNIWLDDAALQAYQRLYQAAATAGIASPHLKIASGHRDYDRQRGIWRDRLMSVMRGTDCEDLDCVEPAINRTSDALKTTPIPHARNAWRDRFRQELMQAGCAASCDIDRALQEARRTVAPPGTSPHHTGRAVDIFVGRAPGAPSSASSKPEHVAWQRRQASYQWMVCNAARFDFYPYNVEPWHWEYNPQS